MWWLSWHHLGHSTLILFLILIGYWLQISCSPLQVYAPNAVPGYTRFIVVLDPNQATSPLQELANQLVHLRQTFAAAITCPLNLLAEKLSGPHPEQLQSLFDSNDKIEVLEAGLDSLVIIRHIYTMPFLIGYSLDVKQIGETLKATGPLSFSHHHKHSHLHLEMQDTAKDKVKASTGSYSMASILQHIQNNLEGVQFIEPCGDAYLDAPVRQSLSTHLEEHLPSQNTQDILSDESKATSSDLAGLSESADVASTKKMYDSTILRALQRTRQKESSRIQENLSNAGEQAASFEVNEIEGDDIIEDDYLNVEKANFYKEKRNHLDKEKGNDFFASESNYFNITTLGLSELTGRFAGSGRVLAQGDSEWDINFDYHDMARHSSHHAITQNLLHSFDEEAAGFAKIMTGRHSWPKEQPQFEGRSKHIRSLNVQTNAPWNLERLNVRSVSGMTGNYTYAPSSGLGVSVYIIDSGIQTDHIDFQGRATFPVDFTADRATGAATSASFSKAPFRSYSGSDAVVRDDLGHGTHVAGIVGGALFGVAKQSQLIGVKVFGGRGATSWATILAAFSYVYEDIQRSQKHAIVNLSLRGDYLEAANRAVAGFRRAGIPVVVSAGNDGANACQFSPASAPEAITVAAVSMLDTFLMSPPSNGGHCVNLLAPGGAIVSDFIGSSSDEIFLLSGTSMAAPHVSGALALLWSTYPFLSCEELLQRLFMRAVPRAIGGLVLDTPNLMLRV